MIDKLLFQALGAPGKVTQQGRQFTFNCPRCAEANNGGSPDGRYNLEVAINKIIKGKRVNRFNCWKCSFKGDPHFLISKYGGKNALAHYESYVQDFLLMDIPERKIYPLRLPNEFIAVADAQPNNIYHRQALDYLTKERNIDLETLIKFNIGFAVEGRYKERIIIPSYDQYKTLNYFVARSYSDHEQKYDNPYLDKSGIIFNEFYIDWFSPIFLTEGAFELLALPVNNIPMLGKSLPDLLLEKIIHFKCKIILALNMDAFGSTNKVFDEETIWRSSTNSTISIAHKLRSAGAKDIRYLHMSENDLQDIQQNSDRNCIFTELRENIRDIPWL